MEAGGGGMSKMFGSAGISSCLVLSAFSCVILKFAGGAICEKVDTKTRKTCSKLQKVSVWLAVASFVAALLLGLMTGELAPIFRMFSKEKHSGHRSRYDPYSRY